MSATSLDRLVHQALVVPMQRRAEGERLQAIEAVPRLFAESRFTEGLNRLFALSPLDPPGAPALHAAVEAGIQVVLARALAPEEPVALMDAVIGERSELQQRVGERAWREFLMAATLGRRLTQSSMDAVFRDHVVLLSEEQTDQFLTAGCVPSAAALTRALAYVDASEAAAARLTLKVETARISTALANARPAERTPGSPEQGL